MLNKKFILTICLILNLINKKTESNNLNSNCKYLELDDDNLACIFSDFNKFNDLVLNCNQTYNSYGTLYFIPSRPILIDTNFEIDKLLNSDNFTSVSTLFMYKFKGIDLNSKSISKAFATDYLSFIYIFSKLDFYYEGSTPVKCDKDLFNMNETPLFANFKYLIFISNKYPVLMCPFIFLKSSISLLYFTDITNSFLSRNLLIFDDVNNSINASEINIEQLRLDVNYISITSKILNKYLFSQTEKIVIYGFLNGIQSDLFLNEFSKFKYFDLQIDNFKAFFHSGNAWMKHLNHLNYKYCEKNEIKSNLNNTFILRFKYKVYESFINEIYEYPDEDFCLFQHFPHDNLVIPLFVPGKRIECSCTLLWLIQYYNYYFDLSFNDTDYYAGKLYFIYDELGQEDLSDTIKYCHDTQFSQSLLKCHFEKRLANCKNSNFEANLEKNDYYESKFYLNNDTDFLYLVKWLQFIFLIIVRPILSLISIINNALVIIIIKNKNMKNNFKTIMFKHIIIYSYFAIGYCLIMSLDLIDQCIFSNSIFCSSIYLTKPIQRVKIYGVIFLGGVFKFCKNFSFLMFTFSRFVTSLDKKKGIYEKFKKMKLNIYVVLLFMFSLLLNMFKVFQYKRFTYMNISLEFPKEDYDEKTCSLEFEAITIAYCNFFSTMKIIILFINNFSLYILNLIVDLLLLVGMRGHFKKRHNITAKNSNSRKNEREANNKAKRMTIITNFFYLLSYLPELIVSIIFVIYSHKLSKFSNFNFPSFLISEELETLGLISIILNFFNLVYFNKKFNESYEDIKKKIKMIISNKKESIHL